MPSIYNLKSSFQALLRPLTRRLAAMGVTANQVTLLALLLSVANGTCIAVWPAASWPLLLVAPLLFVRMALNAIDGMLAREHAMKSRLGCILNELGDVISDAALYLPLALVPGVPASLVVVAVLLAVISEMAGVVAIQVGADRRYDGPMGKSDRAFIFAILALAIGCGVPVGRWINVVLFVMIGLLVVTIFNRCRRALQSATVVDRNENDGVESHSKTTETT
jgi:CDP-diacylglycerol---glycerol-3-phosphate 3-phosphatidyltransferase